MKIRHILTATLCAGVISAYAIPAKKGVTHTLTQPDGTEVTLSLAGDEHHHYYLTADSNIVIGNDGKYTYATLDTNGNLINSGVLAHNMLQRTTKEIQLVRNLDAKRVSAAYTAKVAPKNARESRAEGMDFFGRRDVTFATQGDVPVVVILAAYADLPFVTPDPHDYFSRMLNEEGFSDNGSYGSARDFYITASNGRFKPDFNVYGPVTLPHNQSYYGSNGMFGDDVRPQDMIRDAVKAIDKEVDFRDYDLDGDKKIDNIFVIFAGVGEAQGGGANAVWPHQGTMTYNASNYADGVRMHRYACTSELSAQDHTDGVGTFIHEFGHVLGLPDLYNTEDPLTSYTPGKYSAMDYGSYNNDSKQPPTFSAYERMALGWMGDDLVEISGAASCRLEPMLEGNKAYLIHTDNPNEIFLFENRQQSGWDEYLPHHGMLIWHINYLPSIWESNKVNNDKKLQRIDLVEASGTTSASAAQLRKYPFPGELGVTEYVFGGKPDFKAWSGHDMALPVTNIAETDGVITFDVAGGGADPAGVNDALIGGALSYSLDSRRIRATADGVITVTDMAGRIVASASGELSTSALHPGVYIIGAEAKTVKVLVK